MTEQNQDNNTQKIQATAWRVVLSDGAAYHIIVFGANSDLPTILREAKAQNKDYVEFFLLDKIKISDKTGQPVVEYNFIGFDPHDVKSYAGMKDID